MKATITSTKRVGGFSFTESLPDFMSGLTSLFFPVNQRRRFERYMRGNVADDWRRDWQAIGNDMKTAMSQYNSNGNGQGK